MPTSAASCATAGRMRSTSVAKASSARGSCVPGGCGSTLRLLIEIALEDQLGSDLVAARATSSAAFAGPSQPHLRVLRRMALVDFDDRQCEAPGELACEAARTLRHGVLGAIGVHRDPDDQAIRAPLADQRGDRGEAPLADFALDGRERM